MFKIPYNQVHVHGTNVFAARAGQIHSFNLENGNHISAWKHPDVEKVSNTLKEAAAAAAEQATTAEATAESAANKKEEEEADYDEPPAKRQKTVVEEEKEVGDDPAPNAATDKTQQEVKDVKRKGKKSKNRNKDTEGGGRPGQEGRSRVSRTPDRPVITHLTSTVDGKYLLAISGHDKTIWVFENNEGTLKLQSQRIMPKRPSSVAIGPDAQILCADKFGDVYSLPLIATDASPEVSASAARPSAPKPRTKPAASELTVHSKKNLQALKAQQKQIEQEKEMQGKKGGAKDTDSKNDAAAPGFDLTLLLGHVSMLTDLVLGEKDGRRYILTADRDEHIRVSRYIPQAHVIEGFCLGHKDFISSMTIPATRPELLVSGGGDAEIFVWDWVAERLLTKTDILSLVQEVSPETTKIALSLVESVSFATESGNVTYLLAICEGIKAIFSWQLAKSNELLHPSTIQLSGNPFHLSIGQSGSASPRIVAAIDAGEEAEAKSLVSYSVAMQDGKLTVCSTATDFSGEGIETDDMKATADEIKNLLYGIENLRKQPGEGGEDGGEGEAGGVEAEA